MNAWFKNQPELYITTLTLQLEMAQMVKLVTHNVAFYRPQLRQMDQSTILQYAALNVDISDYKWQVLPCPRDGIESPSAFYKV